MLKKIILAFIILFYTTSSFSQDDFFIRLADSTVQLTKTNVTYDPAYVKIGYPWGDVPANTGVCTDVVIRSYRKLGIDLQSKVHDDMKSNFLQYPNNWGRTAPDPNIDHRRVPNLMKFFSRHGIVKPNSYKNSDYMPGDIVCWRLPGGLQHIGLLIREKSADGSRYLVVHNIGRGQEISDCLFQYNVIGHYSYCPK